MKVGNESLGNHKCVWREDEDVRLSRARNDAIAVSGFPREALERSKRGRPYGDNGTSCFK